MNVSTTNIDGLLVIKPTVYGDERGHFFESYREDFMNSHGIKSNFVQDNQSLSSKGILRGLHFQREPFSQGKLVRVIKGSVLDVAVDIRHKSPTYGHHFSIELNEENKTMFYIPSGFAHGFLTLEDNTDGYTYNGTSSIGISTPRSPLATIIALVARMISSILST